MPKSAFRLPKRGLTNSGKVLLRMRYGRGVPKKQLSRYFNLSVKIVRKYLSEENLTPEYTLSPERKECIESRRNWSKTWNRMKDLSKNWPPNSPDLSPIENAWPMVQEVVDEKTPSDKSSLIRCIRNAWSRLPHKMIDNNCFEFRCSPQSVYKIERRKSEKMVNVKYINYHELFFLIPVFSA